MDLDLSSIADIANEAGVSVSTVSLVANKKGSISNETRQRVEALIERYAFRPRAKRHGKPGKTADGAASSGIFNASPAMALGTICVVSPQLSSAAVHPAGVYRFWAEALQAQILKHGGNFSYLTGVLLAKNNQAFQKGLAEGMFKGVILVGVEQGDGYVEATLRSGVPFVVINRRPLHGEFSSVGPDNFGGGRLAAEHLIALGHRRIGMINPVSTSAISHHTEARRSGFNFALKSHDLEPVCELQYSPETARMNMEAVTRKVIASDATAMFLSTDMQAVTFIDQWEKLGRKVPADMSIVGFDNADVKTASGLRLTTISHDSEQLAMRSIKMLQNMMRSSSAVTATCETVSVELMIGDTSAAPVQK